MNVTSKIQVFNTMHEWYNDAPDQFYTDEHCIMDSEQNYQKVSVLLQALLFFT